MRYLVCYLFIVVGALGCDRMHGIFSTYDDFIESSFFKGGWVLDSLLLKSTFDIHVSNDLDNNKVWLYFNDSLLCSK